MIDINYFLGVFIDKMSYFEENFVIVVYRNGKMTSVPRELGEINHYQPFRRLNEKINGIKL